jgi:hypothetical protein
MRDKHRLMGQIGVTHRSECSGVLKIRYDAEEVKLTAEEEEAEAGVRRATQAAESAVWRLTEGQGDALDAISASRSARGRLDFVLQASTLNSCVIYCKIHSRCLLAGGLFS